MKNRITIWDCLLVLSVFVVICIVYYYLPQYSDHRMVFSDFESLKKKVTIQLEKVQYPDLTSNEIYVNKYSAITESVYRNSSICGYEIQGTLFSDDKTNFRITVLNGISSIEEYGIINDLKVQNRTVINDTEYGKYVQKYQIIQDDNYEYQVYVSVQTTLQEDGLEELVDRIDKLIGLMMCPILE